MLSRLFHLVLTKCKWLFKANNWLTNLIEGYPVNGNTFLEIDYNSFILQVRARTSSRSSLLYCKISIPRPSVKLGGASPQGRQTPVPRRIGYCCHTIRQRGFSLCYTLHTLFNQNVKCHWYPNHWKMFTTRTIANCWFWRRVKLMRRWNLVVYVAITTWHTLPRGVFPPPSPSVTTVLNRFFPAWLSQKIGTFSEKHRKNCECCPGHSLTVSQPSKSLSL